MPGVGRLGTAQGYHLRLQRVERLCRVRRDLCAWWETWGSVALTWVVGRRTFVGLVSGPKVAALVFEEVVLREVDVMPFDALFLDNGNYLVEGRLFGDELVLAKKASDEAR